ncbi:MAG: hypothetical protein IK088_07400 [Lachnospiraceae bacterium]|nr:hypothetical protein [Lachnospiraceae bacterium]
MAGNKSAGISLRRTAEEVKRYRAWRKLIPIIIGIAVLILVIGYVVSVLYMKFGAFTVSVNKFDNLDYALSLSESKDFSVFTSRLNAEIAEEVTNIDGTTLPNWLDNVDGEHNGENYVAYTFYCKNQGTKIVKYTYEMYIANMTYEIEKAARVRLYVNGEYVDYAYPRTDGIEGPEPGTTAFQSATTIVRKTIDHFKPGDVTKFTVVIWLEGPDPDCVDKIIGGQFKIDMTMTVMGDETETDEAT